MRTLSAWLVTLAAAVAGVALVTTWGSQATAEDEQTARGGDLYQRYCAVCHANDGTGIPDVAPDLAQFSAPRVDLSMRTGRMPLTDRQRGVRERTFSPDERRATMAYLDGLLDLEGELPDPPAGEAAQGREVYAINCAQCHGATGSGGVAGDGVQIPAIVGSDDVTIASATREGPFAMPPFGEALITDQEIGDITAFLDEEVHQPTSPLGRNHVSKFEAIFFAALLTAVVVLVCFWAAGLRHRRPTPPPDERSGNGEG